MSSELSPRRGMMVVMSSPSGAGKTTLTRLLLEQDSEVELSISVTTRPPREGEIDGKDYWFVDDDAFTAAVADNRFLEWAEVFGARYGTLRQPVDAALAAGRDMLFDVDWQGARTLREATGVAVVSIFVLPPSLLELRARLERRAKDPPEVIEKRMSKAEAEISHWDEYDYVLVNRDLEATFARVRAILAAERLRRERQPWLASFVEGLHPPAG